MFAKTWMCHVLHTQNKRKVSNGYIYWIVGTFCVLDLIIITVWYLRDPMGRRMEYFPLENPEHIDDDVKVRILLFCF